MILKLCKDRAAQPRDIEAGIAPPMAMALTIPVLDEFNNDTCIAIYVAVCPFYREHPLAKNDHTARQTLLDVAGRLALREGVGVTR